MRLGTNGTVPNLIYVNLRSRSGDSTKRRVSGMRTEPASEWMSGQGLGDGEWIYCQLTEP